MKTIRFRTLTLENFKGTQNATYDFSDHRITVVGGRNGAGKSTIADGLFWVLFGTDHTGNSKFGLKTRDAEGREIRELPHAVELTLTVDGEETTLRRTLSEQVRRDGSVSNTYGYYVNGDTLTAGEYKKAVSAICDEHIFTLCSSPHVFTSLPWSEQRDALIGIVGQPDETEITGGDKRFDYVVSQLKKESIDAIVKHIAYKRREVQKQLDAIPVRIEELRKVQPSKIDVSAVSDRKKTILSAIEENKNAIAALRNGGIEDMERRRLRSSLDMLYTSKSQMENSARRCAREEAEQRENRRDASIQRKEFAMETLAELKKKQSSLTALMDRAKETLVELEQEKQKGATDWAELSARRWNWDEKESFCPHCGQPYPMNRIEEIRRESEEMFNVRLANDKKNLYQTACEIKDKIKDAQTSIDAWRTEYTDAASEQMVADGILAQAERDIAEIDKEHVKTEAEYLHEKPNYDEVCHQIREHENALSGQMQVDPDAEQKYNAEADRLSAELDETNRKIAECAMYDNIEEQIKNINAERTAYQRQLDDLDEKYDTAVEYNTLSCSALEYRVNAKFEILRWSMFRTQLDGTQKPYCECSFGGVPFADLNTAMRINAGLEIIRVLSEYYGVSVPCVIDNVESVNDPHYPENAQSIALRVTEDEHLRLQYYN